MRLAAPYIACRFLAVFAALLITLGNRCDARDGAPRASPYTPRIDQIFSFSGPRPKAVPAPDCKSADDAQSEFAKAGDKATTLQWPESNNFLEKAYAGTLGFAGRIANVDHLTVIEENSDRFRLYLGSSKIVLGKLVYCGFAEANIINKEWADAGFENKTLFEQLPEYTEWEQTVQDLSSALAGVDYARVHASLLARSFTPIDLQKKPIERCSPGLEGICQNYVEAACAAEFGQAGCIFEWASADQKQLEVSASVTELPDNVNQITVADVEPVKSTDEAAAEQQAASAEAMNSWRQAVADTIQKKVDEAPPVHTGSHQVSFYVGADGRVGSASTPGEEGGDADLANAAVRIVNSVGYVRPPPDQKEARFSIKLRFR